MNRLMPAWTIAINKDDIEIVKRGRWRASQWTDATKSQFIVNSFSSFTDDGQESWLYLSVSFIVWWITGGCDTAEINGSNSRKLLKFTI